MVVIAVTDRSKDHRGISAFIVEHGTIEWRDLTGGQNGLMGITPPSVGSFTFSERDIALMAVAFAGLALYFFYRLANSAWGMGMVAVRDAEVAARSIGLNPTIVKTAAFALSAVLTGLAGAMFDRALRKMTGAFEARAAALYGISRSSAQSAA